MTIGTEHRYIVRDDDILGGEPIVVGTRVPVRAVVELWRLGAALRRFPPTSRISLLPRCLTP